MRILQINSASGFGGGEKHLLDLAFCLKTRGHTIFAAVRPGAVWRERLGFVPNNRILRLSLSNALDLKSAQQLVAFIRENKIEIVHAHLARDYSLAAIAVRLSRTHAKLVLTRHVLFPISRWHKLLLPRETVFIAVSGAVKNSLLKQKLVSPEAINLIYNGIDTQHFGAVNRADLLENLNLAPTRRYVGIIGEITRHKGQTDFIRAAALIAAKHADVDFLIVGDDGSRDKSYRRETEKLVAELKLERRVHFLGWVADVAPVLCALTVFVSASRVEPFGLAIVEAMAAGLPVVATASEGAQEILINNETGKIVSLDDSKAIANAVGEFLDDAEISRRYGEAARAVAREKFDLARMTTETERIYEKVRQNKKL